MWTLIVIMIVCGLGIVLINMMTDELTAMEGFSSQVISLIHIGGIPKLEEGVKCKIGTKPDELLINQTHSLSLKQVKRIQHLKEDNLVDKQKSVLSRALVGGLLLGPVAAIVGGVSGVGTKKTKETQYFLSIDFVDKEDNEQTAVFLTNEKYAREIRILIKDVNEKVGYKAEEEPSSSNPYKI